MCKSGVNQLTGRSVPRASEASHLRDQALLLEVSPDEDDELAQQGAVPTAPSRREDSEAAAL